MAEPEDYGWSGDEDAVDKSDLRALIIDISEEGDVPNTQSLREKYKERVVSLVSPCVQQRPTATNFVCAVLGWDSSVTNDKGEENLFRLSHKKLLLETAVQESFEQLEHQTPENDGGTALHGAVERDKTRQTDFTSFFCNLIKQGIKRNKLTNKNAADIISKINRRGETCLHLALMNDLGAAASLIELADDATFRQQRDNGNTPMHDALEFLVDKSLRKGRYLVGAPKCKMPALTMEMAQCSTKGSADTQPSNFCDQCSNLNKKYEAVKTQRSQTICALLRKCPAALAIHNKAGRSPFSHHVMAREEFRRKRPDINKIMNQRKETRPSNIIINASPKAVLRRSSRSFDPEGVRVPGTKTWENCSPNLPPDCFHLSVEVEKMLWEAAFQIGSYAQACLCLFPSTPTRQDKEAKGNTYAWNAFPRILAEEGDFSDATLVYSEDGGLHEVFIPTGRVTAHTKKQYPHFNFTPTLAYVYLKVTPDPEVDRDAPRAPKERVDWRDESSLALTILFEWLTANKKVKRILKLIVEDNDEFPCSETTIQHCLSMLEDVRYLDWRRPNISVETLMNVKDVVELWLYSTGINAVLSSWADKGGLQRLQKLRKIHLEAKPVLSHTETAALLIKPQGMETEKANKANVERFQDKLKSWYDHTRAAPTVVVDSDSTGAIGGNTIQGRGGADAKRSNPWLTKLCTLTGKLNAAYSPQVPEDDDDNDVADDSNAPSGQASDATDYIRVALLDDGIDPEWGGLGKFVSGWGWPRCGWPQPSEAASRTQPQSFYSPGPLKHGNQMAKLITMACPFVRLYVAKINARNPDGAAHHPTFDVTQAVKAIRWAIEKKVEVISMSWNVMLDDNHEQKKALKDAIRAAHEAGILLFCAASEKRPSTSGNKAWPSSCEETFSIGAASDYRVAKDYVGADANFLFPSDDDGQDGGSSTATALAAGLASLILYCVKSHRQELELETREKEKQIGPKANSKTKQGNHHAHQKQKREQSSNDPRKMIEIVFKDLCQERGTYVDIDPLLGKGEVSYSNITKHCRAFMADLM